MMHASGGSILFVGDVFLVLFRVDKTCARMPHASLHFPFSSSGYDMGQTLIASSFDIT